MHVHKLFICLCRHYQGELYPYFAMLDSKMKESEMLESTVAFSNITSIPWKALTNFNTTWNPDYSLADKLAHASKSIVMPPVTIYTYFRLETCLYGFWILMLVQACLILIAKRITNPMPFKRQNLAKMISHALENCQIPVPMEDWDDHHGSIASYVKAQKKVEHEMAWTLLINLLINLIMCVPMAILGK